ncbi:MAG: hypothetical protein AAGE96_11295 [Cyanobacteria bacterium P01_G01_bin.19]
MFTDWNCPPLRSGFRGWLDRITGTEATTAELLLQFVPPTIFAIAAPIYAQTLAVDWTYLQLGLISLLGFDLVGGVLTNATSSAKRWFHRKGQTWQHHITFVSIHFLHIFLVALLFRNGDWSFLAIASSYLISASALILRTPLYLQRPVAFGLYGLALLGNSYLFAPTVGLEWFLPLFFLKILISHLLKETPYRPE